MQTFSRAPKLAAYRSTAAHGSVAAADPHGLVLLLMNGSLERIAAARGCIQNKAYVEKARLIHRAVAIVDELRASLNLQKGGAVAANLNELYDYMCRQLLTATVTNDTEVLDEVLGLLQRIRDAWLEVPKRIGVLVARK